MGIVPANTTVVKEPTFTMNMSLGQGRTAQAEGILFEITITSDKGASYVPLIRCTRAACAPA